MSEWISCEFGSLYAEPSRNGLTKPKRVRGHGVKFVNMGEIFRHDRLKNLECDRVPLAENEKSALLKNDDLLFARQSLVLAGAGKCSIFLGDIEEVAFESHIIRVRLDQNKANPQFYYYLFRSPQGRSLIEAIVEQGAGASGVRSSDLQSLMIPYTSLPQQKAIARILSSLDDKIELNRRMNETLEAMARAIFKDWFVDFGPTRAKMSGRAAYLPEHLWSLFPEAIDPETGIPTGWKLSRLDELVVLQRGFDLPKSKRQNGNFPVIAASGFNGTHNEYMVEPPGVTTGRSGVLGKVFYIQEKFWPLNTSLWIKQYIDTTPIYAYFLLQNIDFSSFNAGSAVPTLNRNHIHNLFVPKPNIEIIREFSSLAENLFNLQYRNSKSSDDLADLRDRLLPKLMSGEIRVKDAEKLVEEAV